MVPPSAPGTSQPSAPTEPAAPSSPTEPAAPSEPTEPTSTPPDASTADSGGNSASDPGATGSGGAGSGAAGGVEVAGAFNYTIAPGDDFGTLATQFGTTAEAIAAASGLAADQTLYDGMVVRIPTSDQAKAEPPLKAEAIPWSKVNDLWAIGTVAQVIDVETGSTFYALRQGGWAHVDSEPVTSADTAIMLDNYGGQWSWARRSIVVVVNGLRIAASQNAMPHGDEILTNNNFPGEFCIHFLGSTTHGSSYTSNGAPTLDPAHQAAVKRAIGH